jgi:hypothetical protein
VRLQSGDVWQLQAQYVTDAIAEIERLNQRIQELEGPIGKPWKRFHFESNMFFDAVEGPIDWERLRAAYPNKTADDFLDAKEATWRGTVCEHDRAKNPNYGFSQEHDGVKTLRDFMAENKMLELIPPRGN